MLWVSHGVRSRTCVVAYILLCSKVQSGDWNVLTARCYWYQPAELDVLKKKTNSTTIVTGKNKLSYGLITTRVPLEVRYNIIRLLFNTFGSCVNFNLLTTTTNSWYSFIHVDSYAARCFVTFQRFVLKKKTENTLISCLKDIFKRFHDE